MREIKKLDDLMDGAVTERFEDALKQVWENVFNPNTDAKASREVSLVFKFTPNENRDAAGLKADVKMKLAPPMALLQTVLLEKHDDGSIVALERSNQVNGQLDMAGDETKLKRAEFGNVVEFGRK
ncbi:MAG: hypothetical protein PHY64_01355 [Eubacteriales bacterium]|nr:hypothetical protein [Eubacteriales bacterium]